MKHRVLLGILTFALVLNAQAFTVSGGTAYLRYDKAKESDDTGFSKRFSISQSFLIDYNQVSIGGELGMQDGHTHRLDIKSIDYSNLGSVAVQTTLKTFVDALVEISRVVHEKTHTVVFVKAGVAYRELYFDRDTLNTLHKFNPELQAGLKINLKRNFNMLVGYQGIYGGDLKLTTSATTNTGEVKNIPNQQGVLLMFGYNV